MRWKSDRISGWGRHLWADMVLSRASRVAAFKDTFSEQPGPAVGGLRSYGDAALKSDGHAHVMTRLDRFLSFDEENGVLSAQAGITMAEILKVTLPKGWAPSALPGTGFATLGGCIAMDVHGKDHRHTGSFGAQVEELTLMTADGKTHQLSRTRKKDLFLATLGGLGQTGVILDARLKLHKASDAVSISKTRFDALNEGMAQLEASTARFAVAWIDALAPSGDLGRGVLEESDYSDQPPPSKRKKAKAIPLTPPKASMSYWPSRMFNEARFKWLKDADRSIERFMDVQYPLDQLLEWNKLYGKDGFHQFQVNFDEDHSETAIRSVLELVGRQRAASPLVVMKRLGASGDALLGFTRPGFTLAVDFQHRSGTPDLLTQLHDLALEHRGRVYLAKDSSARSSDIQAAYPNLAKWQKIVATVDPDQSMSTDLTKRLELR